MKLSEAIREWKRNITTNMAVEYVLTLRADINAFSDAAQELERENAKLRKFAESYLDAVRNDCGLCPYDDADVCDTETDSMRDGCRLYEEMRELGIGVDG